MAEHDGPTVDEVADIADGLVGRPPEGWETILDSGTSIVLRGGGQIVKCPRRSGESFAAELAGLSIAGPLLRHVVPEVIAVDQSAGVVVMTDLGAGHSVADLLLGDDPVAATDGLVAQAVALGELHNATRDRPAGERRRAIWLDDREHTARAAIRAHVEGSVEMVEVAASFDGLGARLLGPVGPRVLSPGDVCPDNNVVVQGRVRLFDFEGCGDMHPAMDVAYVSLPFPTCWCSFDLPAEAKRAAVDAYAAVVADPVGVVEMDLAVAYFTAVSVGLSLREPDPGDLPLDAGWISETGLSMPSPAQRLVHRLRLVEQSGQVEAEYPPLHRWLRTQLDRCLARWPELEPFPLAPAFRSLS